MPGNKKGSSAREEPGRVQVRGGLCLKFVACESGQSDQATGEECHRRRLRNRRGVALDDQCFGIWSDVFELSVDDQHGIERRAGSEAVDRNVQAAIRSKPTVQIDKAEGKAFAIIVAEAQTLKALADRVHCALFGENREARERCAVERAAQFRRRRRNENDVRRRLSVGVEDRELACAGQNEADILAARNATAEPRCVRCAVGTLEG